MSKTKYFGCSVIENGVKCSGEHEAKGYCSVHYKRLQAHGDPLVTKSYAPNKKWLAWLQQAFLIETDECIIPPGKTGYWRVMDKMVSRRANVIVCEWMHGPPPFPEAEAAHDFHGRRCIDCACVNKRHLSWKDRTDNNHDRIIHGTIGRKLTPTEVQIIRQLSRSGRHTQQSIAHRFGISTGGVQAILTGKTWAWLPVRRIVLRQPCE